MSSRSVASVTDDDDDDEDDDDVMEVDLTDGAADVMTGKKMPKNKRPSISLKIPEGCKSTRERTGMRGECCSFVLLLFNMRPHNSISESVGPSVRP